MWRVWCDVCVLCMTSSIVVFLFSLLLLFHHALFYIFQFHIITGSMVSYSTARFYHKFIYYEHGIIPLFLSRFSLIIFLLDSTVNIFLMAFVWISISFHKSQHILLSYLLLLLFFLNATELYIIIPRLIISYGGEKSLCAGYFYSLIWFFSRLLMIFWLFSVFNLVLALHPYSDQIRFNSKSWDMGKCAIGETMFYTLVY